MVHSARITITGFVLCQTLLLAGFLVYGKAEAALFRKASAWRNFNQSIQSIPLLESAGYSAGDDAHAFFAFDAITIDEDALVPDVGSAGSVRDVSEMPASDLVSLYKVRSGDTIAIVADMFGVSVNTIRWANNIPAGAGLYVGQELTILPISGVRHTVRNGETLQSIAAKYRGDLEDIASYNGLGIADTIALGDIVIIPDGEPVALASAGTSRPKVSLSKTTGSLPANGYYIRPANGVLTQGFHGPHQAIDIGAPIGTPIFASASGTVIVSRDSGYNGGYGKMVVIEHANGSQTWYAHANKVHVTVGQKVSQGEHIADIGSTGRSTGPHLHFEVRGVRTPILYAGSNR